MARAGLFARKSVADIRAGGESEGHQGLKRSLGATSITALGIGAIIGTGIFVLTGTAAAEHAGPAIVLSFIFCGIACGFVGLCYAELAALIPVAGSSYTYTYATLGEIFAWIIGWDLILEYTLGGATVAVGWSGYAVSLLQSFGIHFPAEWAAPYGAVIKQADGTTLTGILNLPAAFIVMVVTALLILGTRESARTNNIIVAVKLAVVLIFIGAGIGFINPANHVPFIPENTGTFGAFGWSGILAGGSVIFFAFIGFDGVSTAAQEARNPQRDMPIGILGSLFICTILYVIVSWVMTGLVKYDELNVAAPIAKAIDVIGLPWLSILVKAGAFAGLTTVILVLLYGQTRIFFTMSRDGLMPKVFSDVHPRFSTPWLSQLLIGVIVAIVAAVFPIGELGDMVNIGTLFAFVLVCGAVIYLRHSDADLPRPFRVPGVPVVPVLGMLCCIALMAGLPIEAWERLVIWLVIGLAIYFVYGFHHSVLRRKNNGA